jgi:hypothetical protein
MEKGTKEKPFGSTRAYVARFCWSRRAAAAPAIVAAAGRVLMDRGWMTEMSAMVIPPYKARRMSPRASTRVLAPEAEMPTPPGSPGRRLRVGSWVEAMPAMCTTRRKMPFRMSRRNVVCTARDGHRIPWSTSVGRKGAPQSHCTAGALEGSMLMPRRWRRPVWTSPLLRSSDLLRGRVSSHAEAGRHAQLSKRVRPLRPSVVLGSKDSSRASAQVCDVCRKNSRCAAAIVPGLSELTSWYSGGHRVPAL